MPYIGELAALTGAFFWGWCAIFFAAAGRRIGPFATNVWRIILAIIFLCTTLYFSKGHPVPAGVTRSQIFWLGLSGVVGIAIGDGALFAAFVILGPRISTLLLSLAPAITTVLAWFLFDERLGLVAISGILLTIGGIAWVVNERNTSEPVHGSKVKGIILGLIAAIGQGTGVILAKQGLSGSIGTLEATILRMVPSAVALWFFALLTGQIKNTFRSLLDKRALSATLGGAVFGPYLGIWLSLVALKHTDAGIASTLLSTVPILILPMVVFVQRVKISPRTMLGTVIAVAGIALLFLR